GRSSRGHLVHRTTCSCHVGIELDLAKSLLVLSNILSQYMEQRFRLLWAQIDPLEVGDLDLFRCLLPQSAEGEKEVPDAHAYLDAVGVPFTILRGIDQLYIGLRRKLRHEGSFRNEFEHSGYDKARDQGKARETRVASRQPVTANPASHVVS